MLTATQTQCQWQTEDFNATHQKRLVMATGLFRNVAKGGIYFGSYTDRTGRRRQFSTRTKNEREARKIFIATLQRIFEEEDKPKLREITLSKFSEEYLASRKGEQLSPKTLKAITQSLTHLERAIGNKIIHSITVQECERFLSSGWRSEGWKTLHVPRRHYENLRCAFDFAKRWSYLRENPFLQIKKPKPIELIPEILTRREQQIFFESLPDIERHERRFRNIFVLAVNTGLRLGELRFLERRDIDFSTGIIRVRIKENFRPKGKRERSVPLSEDAVRAVRSQLEENANANSPNVSDSTYIFPNPWGHPLSNGAIEPVFREYARRLFPDRKKLRFHSLRHSYASFLAERGVPMQQIQKIMGHASIRTTEKYARLRENDFNASLEALNNVPPLVRSSYTTPEAFDEQLQESSYLTLQSNTKPIQNQ